MDIIYARTPQETGEARSLFREYEAYRNILIVWSDRDPAFPLEIPMEMYHSLPNVAMWVIPQQGHTSLWVDMGGNAWAAAGFGKFAQNFLAQEKVSGGKWF